ncbi:hypothetical protein P3S68_019201 [Capsicum galapagoense]
MKTMAHFGGSINCFTPWLSNYGIVTYHTTIFRKPWKQTCFPWLPYHGKPPSKQAVSGCTHGLSREEAEELRAIREGILWWKIYGG